MTATTPLESVHKKGIFGDHHKKNEKDLMRISELKYLKIFQIVQYKKSNTQISTFNIEDLEFPKAPLEVKSNKNTRILWNGPRTWLIISDKENIVGLIKKKFTEENFAVTDISHSRAVIQVKGLQAKEVLKKGCPINLNNFKVNHCAGTVFNGITILVDFIDNNPDTYNLLTLRSFGESFYHHVADASLEYGYVGV